MEEAQGDEVSTVSAVEQLDDISTPTGRAAQQTSQEWLDRIVADSGGDDVVLLQLIQEHLGVCADHATAIRQLRAEALIRAREAGKSNIELKDLTGLSDSGISRAAIGAGGKRLVNRRSGLPDRRAGGAERRSSGSP